MALDTNANFLLNSPYLQQLSRTALLSSSVNRQAVSVQTSTGVVIGCARFERLFPVDATFRGKHVFSQFVKYFPARLLDVSDLDILQYSILEGIAGKCTSRPKIFDPWNPPGQRVGDRNTNDLFPVGDLPNHEHSLLNFIFEVPLIGNATILGHVLSSKSSVRALWCSVNMIMPPPFGAWS